MGKFQDLTGMVFGRLHVINRGDDYISPNGKKYSQWWCWCDCENTIPLKERNIILIKSNDMIRSRKQSCGCIQKERKQEKLKEKEQLKKQKEFNKKLEKENRYDLTQEYGIGYTSKGEEFWFDKEDYELIKNYTWYFGTKGEVIAKVNHTSLLLHRLVMNVTDFEIQVDHIKHKRFDNRKSQLRIVDNSKNQMNSKKRKDNTSGCKGVSWHKKNGMWYAYINVNKKRIHLGYFHKLEEAIRVRKNAEKKYFGKYSYDHSMKNDTN